MASREERRRMKKKRKKLEKGGVLNQADDYFDVYGPDARAELQLQTERHFKAGQTAISVKDAQLLLQWASSPVGATMQPGWAFVRNKPLCQKVVVLALGGVDAKGWAEHHRRFPRLCELSPASQRVAIKLPKYSKTAAMGPESLLEVQKIAPTDKRARTEDAGASAASGSTIKPHELLLSSSDLTENRYPRLAALEAGSAELAEYVATPVHTGPGEAPVKMFAVDCEMCYTQHGLELTRVTMLSQYGVKLVDMLVLPTNPITDYNTAYSGITAKMLDGVTTRLDDARKALFEHGVHSQSILVGHSLENDLRALKLVHERVIDTALCFPHPEPPYKYGLRKLAETWLGRHIQAGNATGEGHDSAEDASAALQLVQLKLRRGLDFGVPSRDTSSLFQELNEHGRKSTLVHCAPRCRKYSAEPVDIIPADNIAAVLQSTAPLLKRSAAHFVWAHLPSPQSSLPGARAAHRGGSTEGSDEADLAWMTEQDEAVSKLVKLCPPSTLVVVLAMEQKPSSNSDPRSEGTVLVVMTR